LGPKTSEELKYFKKPWTLDHAFDSEWSGVPRQNTLGGLESSSAVQMSLMVFPNLLVRKDLKFALRDEQFYWLIGPVFKGGGGFDTDGEDFIHNYYGGFRLALRSSNNVGSNLRDRQEISWTIGHLKVQVISCRSLSPDYYVDMAAGRSETLPNVRLDAEFNFRMLDIGEAASASRVFGFIKLNSAAGDKDYFILGFYTQIPTGGIPTLLKQIHL